MARKKHDALWPIGWSDTNMEGSRVTYGMIQYIRYTYDVYLIHSYLCIYLFMWDIFFGDTGPLTR